MRTIRSFATVLITLAAIAVGAPGAALADKCDDEQAQACGQGEYCLEGCCVLVPG